MSHAAESGAGAHDALVEEFGVHIGRAMGWPPMAGRAAGMLMLSEEPLTLAQLQSSLDASKGSLSEMTRLLMDNGTVERFKPPGQRHYVYRWRDDAWVGCLRHIIDSTAQLRDLAERAQEPGARMAATQQERLREMRQYYRFMVEHLEALLVQFTALRRTREATPGEQAATR